MTVITICQALLVGIFAGEVLSSSVDELNESNQTELNATLLFYESNNYCSPDGRTKYLSAEERDAEYPTFMRDFPRIILVVNVNLITFIGGCGNMLTLAAVPYSYFRYNDMFCHLSGYIIALLLHLSFCDFAYIITGLPLVTSIYIHQGFIYDDWVCWATAFFRNIIAYADFLTLAFIAIIKMYGVVNMYNFDRQERLRRGRYCAVVCALTWLISFLFNLPLIFGMPGFGIFGFNANYALCNTVHCPQTEGFAPHALVYTIGFFVPFFTVMLSYMFVIPLFVKNETENIISSRKASSCDLGRSESLARDRISVNRERSVAKGLLMLTIAYTIFTAPLVVVEWLHVADLSETTKSWATIIGYNWYWWIFAINFIVYILWFKEFREMYKLFLSDLKTKLFPL